MSGLPSTSTPAPAANAPKLRHPAWELLARYRAIFHAAWRHRHELAGPTRLADEAAFLPAALSLQDTPVHPAPRRLAFALIALFLIALAWAIFGHVDIVAVAPGRIIVSERTKLIQPLSASVVKRVLVQDGDHVQAGQALVELDPTSASADKASIDEQLKSAQSEVLRSGVLLQALARPGQTPELDIGAPAGWDDDRMRAARVQLADEWSDIRSRLAKAASEIQRRQAEIATVREMVAKLEATLPLARKREADFRQLADQGFMSSHLTQDRARERIELERDLATQRARLAEAHATLRESENTRSAYIAETRNGLRARESAAELKRQQATQEQAKAEQRERLTTLKAPVAGTVQQLAAHTEGGVVTEAQALMVIVPDGAQMTAEVTLDNKDIGFVNVDQPAEIKLETFPFTRYGTVGATVTYLFGRGDGQDMLRAYDATPDKFNVLRFKDGVTPSDVIARQVADYHWGGNALELSIAGTGDKVTISGFFYGDTTHSAYNPVQQVEFADGTRWDMSAVLDKIFGGTDGDDTMTGTGGDNLFSGGAGNDTIVGGLGNASYLFGRNANHDVIRDDKASAGNVQIVSFGPEVTADPLWLQGQDDNLAVSIIGTNDWLSTANGTLGYEYQGEQIMTCGGELTIESRVQNMVQAMASFAPPAMGQSHLSPEGRGSLEPVLAASWG